MRRNWVRQKAPELIHPAHEPPPVEQMTHEMKEIERHGRPTHLVIEEVRDVEADERVPGELRHHRVLLVVEHPRVIAASELTPAHETGKQPLGVRRIEKLDQARQPAGRSLQRQCAVQRLVEV